MIPLSRCELVIDFLGQLFCVLNEILYSLLVSEFVNLVWQMNAQKQKGQTLNAAFAQKAIYVLKVLSDFSFCLFVLDILIFIQDEREGIRSQNLFCLINTNASLCSCFCPFLHGLFLILCMVSTTPTFLVWVLKNQVFLAWYYSIVY